MPTVAVANLKGGVGKSTLAVNLAGALAPHSVLIDADPQATATAWAEPGELPFEVVPMPLGERDPSGWIAAVMDRPEKWRIVDLPPMLGAATGAALATCELAVIPVTPSGADLKATAGALDLVRRARAVRGGFLPAALLVPSKVDRRTAAGAEVEAVLHDYGEPVGPVIGQRIAHVDAFTSGQWIGSFAPGTAAHGEVKALAAVVKRMAAKAEKAGV